MKIKGLCEVSEDERDTSIIAEVTPLGPLKSGGRVFTKLQRRTSPYSKKSSPSHVQQDQFNRNYYRIEQPGFASSNVDQENKSVNVNIIKYINIYIYTIVFKMFQCFLFTFLVYPLYDYCYIN